MQEKTKKIIQFIITLLFFIFLVFSFGNEYISFHEGKRIVKVEKKVVKQGIKDFSLDKIRDIPETRMYYTPYENLLETIVNDIKNAKNRVFVEVYTLTEPRIIEALKNAKKRGLDVRVILEKNPYKVIKLNNKIFEYLKGNGVTIIWSNPEAFSLNHSKILLVDESLYLSTGNFTHSTFFFNRDFFIFTKDKKIVSELEQVFLIDFQYRNNLLYSDDLLLSPNYSRQKFEKLFSSAKVSLKIYFQYLKDKDLEDLLIKKALEGVNIEIIVSKSSYKKDREELDELMSYGIKIYPIKKYKNHSKAILVDEKYLFIGSINFSTYSLDKNREIGIILKNLDIITSFLEVFNQDFEK